jgi:hypothetical protein
VSESVPEPVPTQFAACELCGSPVANDIQSVALHFAWHRTHRLHSPNCPLQIRNRAQEGTGAYLYPPGCTCGVEDPPAPEGVSVTWHPPIPGPGRY